MASAINQMIMFLFPRLQALAAKERSSWLHNPRSASNTGSAQEDLELLRRLRREVLSRRLDTGNPIERQSLLYDMANRHGLTKDPDFKPKWAFLASSRR